MSERCRILGENADGTDVRICTFGPGHAGGCSWELEQHGIAPTATVTPALDVRIERPQTPGRYFDDDGTVLAFLQWCLDTRTFPLNGATSGPGFYHGTFDAADAPAIKAWLREHRVLA